MQILIDVPPAAVKLQNNGCTKCYMAGKIPSRNTYTLNYGTKAAIPQV